MDELLNGLMAAVKKNKKISLGPVKQAYLFAKEMHEGQLRKSGEPYIVHPVEVAKILIDLGMDVQTVIAGLLHDVIEDTPVSFETIRKEFSQEIAYLVNGVTKLSTMKYVSKAESQVENVRKMFLAMAEDIRVIVIKLADRLHNMRTIQFLKEEKQRAKALETMELFAPVAHRLGIRGIKEELEDRSIKVLDPIGCREIEEYLALNRGARQKFLEGIKAKIQDRLISENIKSTIEGRVKNIYGIYHKAYINDREFEEIYDVYALRIILNTELDCYNMLGIVHDMFRPIPNRFKDYISTPKPNMYQSLHTTVVDSSAVPFEIQIRTWDMHYTAEYGIAAHWKYKAGLGNKKDKFEKRLTWLRQLLEVQNESDAADDIILSIKSDFIPEEVYVFTPKGDVKSLPKGSTTIDFAYSIHTDIGNHMVSAKVDGRIVPIDYIIRTGEIIEVITSEKSHGPSKNWLKVVKSSEARSKIKSWFKSVNREENIEEGKVEFSRILRKNSINLTEKQLKAFVSDIAGFYRFNEVDDFYAAIGYGGISLSAIMPKIKELYDKTYCVQTPELQLPEPGMFANSFSKPNSVVVENLKDCLIRFAKCCDPLPGDEIVGFVTRGYGVSIHKCSCKNALVAQKDSLQMERWVRADWNVDALGGKFNTVIEIIGTNNTELFTNVAAKILEAKLKIVGIEAKEVEMHRLQIRITIGVKNLVQLNRVLSAIRSVQGVISARRFSNVK